MKKDIRTKVEAYLKKRAMEYKELLCLQGYHDPVITWKEELSTGGFMQVEDPYPYRFINIQFGNKVVEAFEAKEFSAIDRCLLHEMCHIVLSHFNSKGSTRSTAKELDDALEDTCEHLTRIVWTLR